MKSSFVLLIAAAFSDAVWNIALKKSDGIFDWKTNVVGVFFVAMAIITFKKAIDKIPLSIGIVICSGVTILLTILLDGILYKTRIDFKTGFFMLICILSILGMNYFYGK